MKVKFTGLEIDAKDLKSKEVQPPFPPGWNKVILSTEISDHHVHAKPAIRNYLSANSIGRWSMITSSGVSGEGRYIPIVFLAFENPNDGLLLKLTGLDIICKEYESQTQELF